MATHPQPRGPGEQDRTLIARSLKGEQVLSAYERVDPLGWAVLVEQPLDEAFAPLYASMLRTVVPAAARPGAVDRGQPGAGPADGHADPGAPDRGRADRRRRAEPPDRGQDRRRARGAGRIVQHDDRPPARVVRRAGAEGRGADPRPGRGAGAADGDQRDPAGDRLLADGRAAGAGRRRRAGRPPLRHLLRQRDARRRRHPAAWSRYVVASEDTTRRRALDLALARPRATDCPALPIAGSVAGRAVPTAGRSTSATSRSCRKRSIPSTRCELRRRQPDDARVAADPGEASRSARSCCVGWRSGRSPSSRSRCWRRSRTRRSSRSRTSACSRSCRRPTAPSKWHRQHKSEFLANMSPRAADAAQRHHRVLRGADRADVRRPERAAG